ncbi:MAG TPA: dicarboxylate/amino acid:cation symporter [Pyrinomonadaceae bacterium]|jgi:DAACS family dicarboxylate/amino acid:cation (Na+ or H+) symporter|nr:dicarboxylate/amino acid:cation symporter [Pyrinomonadaceae bacterium]
MSEQENKPNEELAPDSFEQELRTDLDDATTDKPRGLALHTKVLIGLVVGVIGGVGCHELFGDNPNLGWFIDNFTNPIGQLFLSLLLMIVVPLVFSSLIVGVAGIGDIRKLGRIGLKSFAYCLIISAISVVIGLGLANTIQPGKRISQETATKMKDQFGSAAKSQLESQKKSEEVAKQDTALMSVVKTIVPKNIFYSIGSGENPNMLHVMFFALIIGIAITLLPADRTQTFVGFMESLFQISSKLIDIIMKLAPYAVACLIFTNMARFGIELLFALGWFVAAVLIGLSLHMFGVYSLSVYFLSKLNPLDFFRRVRTVILTAFSTSSSNATLPTALRVSEENLGVPREINSFVLTVGATANQNGTALYEGITVLFLAQLAGVELSLGAQLMVVYLAILGGIGTAGVPSGSIPFIIGILAMIGVDPALIAIILGVDRLLDMCRTTLNVVGDITAATYVARSEGYELLKTHPAEAS